MDLLPRNDVITVTFKHGLNMKVCSLHYIAYKNDDDISAFECTCLEANYVLDFTHDNMAALLLEFFNQTTDK